MAGNSFGNIFRITSFGESHGLVIGCVIDGCPAGIDLNEADIQVDLDRRRPGQSKIVTQRKEKDQVKILSGIFEGKTTGSPIAMIIENQDQKSKDYSHIEHKYRPSHADYVYSQKYGIRDFRGGGRSSARETAARVMGGAVAKKILEQYGISINAYVHQVGNIKADDNYLNLDLSLTETNEVRCPDTEVATQMIEFIKQIKKQGDTVGGIVKCIVNDCLVGLGEPVFDKLSADLAKAMLSINAVKGFEIGSGFSSVTMRGSEHNDAFTKKDGKIVTKTNHSGGIQAGISNGMPIHFNVAFKPVSTIMKEQDSIDIDGNSTTLMGKGRHDPCVVPRAVPIVEAMTALVLVDHLFLFNSTNLKK